MSRTGFLSLTAFILSVAVAGWLGQRYFFVPEAVEPVEAEYFDDGNNKEIEACWADYTTATADLKLYGMAAACGLGSPELDCVATDQGEKCWLTGFGQNICTPEEVDLVIQARDENGQAGVDAMIQRFIADDDIPPAQPSGGCGG